MELVTKGITPSDYKVGVVIARFQINELHHGHKMLVQHVIDNHKHVIVFLGVPRVKNSKRNPLDFDTRKQMVLSEFPDVTVLPLFDQRKNENWSSKLDEALSVPFGESTFLLYGSRDSFIPYYMGKHQTAELSHSTSTDATSIRLKLSEKPINSSDFRAGVIYGNYQHRPYVHPTVDVVVANEKGQILLARKPLEDKFRFIGGFVDPSDADLEAAARRELREETTLSALKMIYIGSKLINDWRYQREENKIMSTLFLTYDWDQMGTATASDDIEEVRYFDMKDLLTKEDVEREIMPEHHELFFILIKKVKELNLIKL